MAAQTAETWFRECLGIGYGHPHPDVLTDLAGLRILRTDTLGSVVAPATTGRDDLAG